LQRGATKGLLNIFKEPGTCFPLYLFLLVPRQKRMPLQSGLEGFISKKKPRLSGNFFKTNFSKLKKMPKQHGIFFYQI